MRNTIRGALLAVAVVGMLGVTQVAMARGGGSSVTSQGSCSQSSDWKLKLSSEDTKTEVEFEVDQNVTGQTWQVKIFENGDRVFSGHKTTAAPSGSFDLRTVTPNPAGSDKFKAVAKNGSTGESCVGTATI